MSLRRVAAAGALVVASGAVFVVFVLGASGGEPGEPVQITVPPGAILSEVADTLAARGVIRSQRLFELYARLRGDDRRIKSGMYELATSSSWGGALEHLTLGTVLTRSVTIPEGFRLRQMAPRIAEITGVTVDSVVAFMEAADIARQLGVPGPGAEGYLFPDTYRFAPGVPVESVLSAMVDRYQALWTEDRRSRLVELEMSEAQLVTLASIVQAEARDVAEMPSISAVYHNRLRDGWLLQADPTVLYALGGPRARLLYAAIDSVADSPYNTYTQRGLPPGPIGAPGEAAIDAALHPTEEDFMYFVARPDGSHHFTRTLAEHNRAKADARRAWDRLAAGTDGQDGSVPPPQ
jgi:UPF0755 protein